MRFNPSISAGIISDIQQSEQALQTALQQVSTGQKVNVPSDNPAATAAYLQSLTASANNDQYTANAQSTLGQAQAADSALSSVVGLLNQAVTLGTSGASSTLSATQRQTLATEVNGILSNVVSQANTTYQGVSIFGGTANGTPAFTADASSATGYTYTGNSGVNQVQVGSNLSVQANIPGNTLFENSNSSVLGALSSLSKALSSGDTAAAGAATTEITSALNYVTEQHTVYGNTINQLNSQENFLSQDKITLSSQQTSLIGVDTAVAAENLSQAEVQNTAVLSSAAKVLQNSLLNYLK